MKRISSVVCLLLLLVSVSVAAAQTDTRTESYLSISASVAYIDSSTLPSSGDFADIRNIGGNTLTDVADPIHQCRSGVVSAGGYSVFTLVTHPGGTLSANTVGSNYDTLLSVFNAPGGLPSGAALACNDDTVGFTSSISTVLPAGRYFIMVSSWSVAAAGSALNLVMNLNYTPDSPAPSNDAYTSPTSLTTGVALVQTDIHHATDDATEIALNNTCNIHNSVWYAFTAPDNGGYVFTTQGSSYQYSNSAAFDNTGIAIYSLGLGSYECQSFNVMAGVTTPIYVGEGQTVLVRVGIPFNFNLLPGSRYKIKAVAVSSQVIKTNFDFDAGGTGWKTRNWDAGDSFSVGSAIVNAGALKKSVSQSRSSFPSYIKFVKGGMVELIGYYSYTGSSGGKLSLTVTYSDGRPPKTISSALIVSNGMFVNIPLKLTSAKVKRIRVSATVNPGVGTETLNLDYLYAQYTRSATVARSAAPLALPPAP